MAVFTIEVLRQVLVEIPPDRASVARVARVFRVLYPGFRLATLFSLVRRAIESGDIESDGSRGTKRRICLSPLGAEREGVKLDDRTRCWVYRLSVDPQKVRQSQYYQRASPLTGRILSLAAAEKWGERERASDAPECLLGLSTPWMGPDAWPKGDDCPFHPRRDLKPVEYCLWCDACVKESVADDRPLSGRRPD